MISVKHILCISIHQIFETQRTQKSTSVSRQWTRRCVLKSLVDWLNFDAGWMTTMPPPSTPPAAGRRGVASVCGECVFHCSTTHHVAGCCCCLPERIIYVVKYILFEYHQRDFAYWSVFYSILFSILFCFRFCFFICLSFVFDSNY